MRRRRKIYDALHLTHVSNLQTIDHVDALFHGANRIAVEIGRALLKFRKVLQGSYRSFRPVDLLIEHSA